MDMLNIVGCATLVALFVSFIVVALTLICDNILDALKNRKKLKSVYNQTETKQIKEEIEDIKEDIANLQKDIRDIREIIY